MLNRRKRFAVCCALMLSGTWLASADATIRVVTYNIDADTDRDGLGPTDGSADANDAVYTSTQIANNLISIGGYKLANRAAAPDVVALQELYVTPSLTLNAIINNLNTTYGAGIYAYSTFFGNTSSAVGNGPNGLIYNTKTIKVLSAVGVGSTSSNGAARTPVRYQLQAINETNNNSFFLYNDHAKAGSASTASGNSDNGTRRAYEYDAVRANADTLGVDAHIIYAGDTNFVSAQNEKGYKDLTAAFGTVLNTTGNPSIPSPLIVAGVARAFDPLTGSFSENSNGNVKYYTESGGSLFGRLDMQLITANTLAGSTSPGLQLIPQTYTAFGNSYYNASGVLSTVNTLNASVANNTNATALGLSLAQLQSLVSGTDHLPMVADYAFVPEPGTLSVVGLAIAYGGVRRRRLAMASRDNMRRAS